MNRRSRMRVKFPTGTVGATIQFSDVTVNGLEHAWQVVRRRSITRTGYAYYEYLMRNGDWRRHGRVYLIGVRN